MPTSDVDVGSDTDAVPRDAFDDERENGDGDEDGYALANAGALVAAARDNTVAVSCGDCGRAILRLPLPPGGFHTHDDGDLPKSHCGGIHRSDR